MKVTPIQKIVFSQKRSDSQENKKEKKHNSKNPNKNKDLKWHLTNLFLFGIL